MISKTNLNNVEKATKSPDGSHVILKIKERDDMIRTIRACEKFLRTRERKDEVRLISSLCSFDWSGDD